MMATASCGDCFQEWHEESRSITKTISKHYKIQHPEVVAMWEMGHEHSLYYNNNDELVAWLKNAEHHASLVNFLLKHRIRSYQLVQEL